MFYTACKKKKNLPLIVLVSDHISFIPPTTAQGCLKSSPYFPFPSSHSLPRHQNLSGPLPVRLTAWHHPEVQSFPSHLPRGLSFLLPLLLRTTRDMLIKIVKKNTLRCPLPIEVFKCQSYLPATPWPFWTQTQLSTEEWKTRKSLWVGPDRRQLCHRSPSRK